MNIETNGDFSICAGPFTGTLDSLRHYRCPEWFRDAKFGIWSHWGPQSTAKFGDWYARKMYLEGTEEYRYHCRTYGHPSVFGYKDLIPLWKAEKFDPGKLTELFARAGAKYLVAQAMHHDNFDNFDSKYQPRFNSVAMGPHKDIVGLWKAAADAHGLKFGVSEHLAGSPGFMLASKGCDRSGKYRGVPYDGNDPEYADLYYDASNVDMAWEKNWFCTKPEFYRHWFLRMKDAIDKYQPDLVYTDGPIPCGSYGLDIVAHLYNGSAARNNGENLAVYAQKNAGLPMRDAAVLDIECSREETATPYCWQTDISMGDWFYDVRRPYQTWNETLEMLIDIVSKNGNLLLCVPQLPDGTIDEECEWNLEQIAAWMQINGEAIFGTRCFHTSGEGETVYRRNHAYDGGALEWKPGDVRYTQKDNLVYAFLMRWPGNLAILRSLPAGRERVQSVSLLGCGSVGFEQTGAGLLVHLPDRAPASLINTLKIAIER